MSKKKKSLSKKDLFAMLNKEHDSWHLFHSFVSDISDILVAAESAEERIQLIQNRLLRLKYQQGKKD